jgi:hypothetical protein
MVRYHTHRLERQGQVSSTGLKFWHYGSHSHPTVRTGISGRLKIQQYRSATHQLEGQGEAFSAGLTLRGNSHSHPEEPRTCIVSNRPETQKSTAVTHRLKSQGQDY